MIDFKNGTYVKLKKIGETPNDINALLIPGEELIGSYKGIDDYVVFTSKRVISVNAQGLTEKKKDFTSLPYSKILSVEKSGVFGVDRVGMHFSGLGLVKFDFTNDSDLVKIGEIIDRAVYENDLREEAREEGRAEMRIDMQINTICILMEKQGMTYEEACNFLDIPKEEWNLYREGVEEKEFLQQSFHRRGR